MPTNIYDVILKNIISSVLGSVDVSSSPLLAAIFAFSKAEEAQCSHST
jgi:hypothetical protein